MVFLYICVEPDLHGIPLQRVLCDPGTCSCFSEGFLKLSNTTANAEGHSQSAFCKEQEGKQVYVHIYHYFPAT